MPASIQKMMEQSPLPSLIEGIGVAIARAQLAMDESSVQILQKLATTQVPIGSGDKATKRTLLELGFTPAFYSISEVTLEAKVAFSMTSSEEFDATANLRVGTPVSIVCVTVDAHYSNKYSFAAEGSSSITARFVALPPPQLLRDVVEAERRPAQPAKKP